MNGSSTEKRRLTSRDLLRFEMADDPQISPDGTRVAWVRTWMDPQLNGYRSQISLTDLESGETHPLTAGAGLETHPRWSPDGRWLAYLAPSVAPALEAALVGPAVTMVGKGQQLWVVAASGGQTQQVTRLDSGVGEPTWSPDGSRIAFTTYADPLHGLELPDVEVSDDPYELFNRDVLVVNRLRWKSDAAGLVGNYRRHVAWVAVGEGNLDASEPTLLTLGEFDLSSPTWSPDGKTLAVVGNLDADGDEARKGCIYLLEADGNAPVELQPLFALEEMRSSDLSWSPDGATLAVCGHNDPIMGHYGNQRLWLVSVADGSARCVTEHLDYTFGDYSRNADMRRYGGDDGPRWLPDGQSLLLLVNEGGNVHLNEFRLADGSLTPLTEGDRCIVAFTMDEAAERVTVLIAEDLNPADVYLLERSDGGVREPRRLTAVNESLLVELELEPTIRFQFESDGLQVDGWLIPPVGREPGKQYPLILYPGGGPGSMRASVFCHEFLLYGAQGYAVVHCNARGNHGYGEAFSKAIRGRWGDADYRDNMACVRAALEQFDFLDAERLGVAGGSYGGYSTAWIISHEQQFRAAVVDRCLFNRYSFNGTSDMGFLLDRVEFERKYPWEIPDTYIEWSPLTYVGNVRTPTLVVHSEQDYRCPVEQGEQLYMALKRLGVPTELVRFPNENHDLSRGGRPWHRVFRLDRYLDWWVRWL